MSFTSYDFLSFFLILFTLYWLAAGTSLQNVILLAASYFFYGWIQPWVAVLLGISTLADFFLARMMDRSATRKQGLLSVSLLINLGTLAFFKYFYFFSDRVNAAFQDAGIHIESLLLAILLPTGLSFFTLKKLGYMIDVSRGTLKPSHSLIDFALFVSFFPQIIAGPIERPQKLLPQIEAQRFWRMEYFYEAWPLLA